MLTEYTKVILVSDKYEEEGGRKGMVGYIIEVYPNGHYEVEFSDQANGITLAQLVVSEQDIIVVSEPTNGHTAS